MTRPRYTRAWGEQDPAELRAAARGRAGGSTRVPGGPSLQVSEDRAHPVPPTAYLDRQGVPGRALPSTQRTWFERRLGADLGAVRLHDDARAAEAAEAAGARALTRGAHIYLGRGEGRPETRQGRRVLAHELAHSLQARPGGAPTILAPDHPAEAEADRVSAAVLAGRAAPTVRQRITGVARDPKPGAPYDADALSARPGWQWPWWYLLDPALQIQLGQRPGKGAAFDPGADLALTSLHHRAGSRLLLAWNYSQATGKPFDKSLELFEGLGGEKDSFLHVAGAPLGLDLSKHLETGLGDASKAHPGWLIAYGLPIYGGLLGLSQANKEDLDFATLLGTGLKSFTDLPAGTARPMQVGKTGDPLWRTYGFGSVPAGLTAKYSGLHDPTRQRSLDLGLSLNLASILGHLPEDAAGKKAWRGLEVAPWLRLRHNFQEEGRPSSPTGTLLQGGALFGDQGVYTLAEAGLRLSDQGALGEAYWRTGMRLRPPGTTVSADAEYSHRPDSPEALRARLNFALVTSLVDDRHLSSSMGFKLGGLLPGAKGAAGSVDWALMYSIYAKSYLGGDPKAFRSGLDLTAESRRLDPFDAGSARALGLVGNLRLFDVLNLSAGYYRYGAGTPGIDAPPGSTLPADEARLMMTVDPTLLIRLMAGGRR